MQTDFRTLSNSELGSLGRDLKSALVSNCALKACGYTLESGKDVTPVDYNTISFFLQGNAVCYAADCLHLTLTLALPTL